MWDLGGVKRRAYELRALPVRYKLLQIRGIKKASLEHKAAQFRLTPSNF